MTKHEHINRMNALVAKAYDFNVTHENQKVVIQSMSGISQSPKVIIFTFGDEKITCQTLYDQFDREKIDALFN